jgi:predicted nucleotidyltransferase
MYKLPTIVFFTSCRFSTEMLFTYIWSMKTSKTKILNQIKRIVREKEPSAKIYLYGSRSRGTAKDDSDWDLLILLNKDDISTEVEREITYPLYDLEFDTGEVISPMIYTEKEWNSKYKVTPFYQNVMREGRLL